MFSKIVSTVGTKLSLGVITLLLILAQTKFFGDSGTGEVRMLMLNITIIVLFTSLLGGPNLVYLVPRTNLFKLVFNAYWWSALMCASVTAVMALLDQNYSWGAWNLFALSFMQSITVVHHMVLVGKEDIKQYNIVSLLHGVLVLGAFLTSLFVFDNMRVSGFVHALYVASGVSLLYSIPVTWKYITPGPLTGLGSTLIKAVRYGFYNQIGAFAQLMNYRLSYYLLEHLSSRGLADVGVYSLGVQISEAIWIVQRAIGAVQYSKISNTGNRAESVLLTLNLIKVSGLLAIAAVIPLVLLPESFYKTVFHPSFGGARIAVLTLSPGIIAFAISGMFSGFFAGVGKHHINTLSSALGLVLTVALGLWLIPAYGIPGAGITASASYCTSTLLQWVVFFATEDAKAHQLIPSRSDFVQLRGLLQNYLGGKNTHNSLD